MRMAKNVDLGCRMMQGWVLEWIGYRMWIRDVDWCCESIICPSCSIVVMWAVLWWMCPRCKIKKVSWWFSYSVTEQEHTWIRTLTIGLLLYMWWPYSITKKQTVQWIMWPEMRTIHWYCLQTAWWWTNILAFTGIAYMWTTDWKTNNWTFELKRIRSILCNP